VKGQTSFEILIIFLVVMSSAVYILGLYMQTNDATIATAIARDELFSQANGKEQTIIIDKVSLEIQNSLPSINVKTKPNNLTSTDFDLDAIKSKIEAATKYKDIAILINRS